MLQLALSAVIWDENLSQTSQLKVHPVQLETTVFLSDAMLAETICIFFLKHLKCLIMKRVILGAALMLTMVLSPAQASDLLMLGSSKTVVQLEAAELIGEQKKRYAQFTRNTDFYGAFAASRSTGAWASQSSANLQHSKEIAVNWCNNFTPTNDCRVISVILSANMNSKTQKAVGLTPSHQKYIKKQYLKKSVQNANRYSALAGNSLYVVSRTRRSFRDRAISDALSDCRRYTSRLKGTEGLERYSVLQKAGALECKILHVTEPK